MNESNLKDILYARARYCIRLANGLLDVGDFYLAGSAIATNQIRDIDIYPTPNRTFNIPQNNQVAVTKNATTIKNEPPLQFCNYKKESLRELISSFDFSHIQAGAYVSDGSVISVEWTEEFLYSKACQTSVFTGSEYPLASALRLLKYHARGEIHERQALTSMLSIITSVVKRGFKDYSDFKDQLDAVDLGLVPDQYPDALQSLRDLYELLSDRKVPDNDGGE